MLGSGAGIGRWNRMLGSDAGTGCWGRTLGSDANIGRWDRAPNRVFTIDTSNLLTACLRLGLNCTTLTVTVVWYLLTEFDGLHLFFWNRYAHSLLIWSEVAVHRMMENEAPRKTAKSCIDHRHIAIQKPFKNQCVFDVFPSKNNGFCNVCWSGQKKNIIKSHQKPLVLNSFSFSSTIVIRANMTFFLRSLLYVSTLVLVECIEI